MTPRIFIESDTAIPQRCDTSLAQVVVYTHKAPDKDAANQDAALVLVHDDETLVVAVADGAGGYAGAGAASAIAVRSMRTAFAASADLPVRAAVLNGFEQAHQGIAQQTSGAATTLVVAELTLSALRTYHAGDSGVLVTGGRGRIKLQTVFHSPTGYAVESGLLDEDEALHHEERHIVSNLLGREPMSVEIGSPLKIAPRDTIAIASDGLFDNLYAEEIAGIISRGGIDDACLQLVHAARSRMHEEAAGVPGKPDDLTVVLVRRNR